MAVRVQVVLDEVERERFRREAEASGLPLSAWLRQAAREKVAATQPRRIASRGELKAFFSAVDRREKGREPDWDEHARVISRSKGSGAADA